MQRLKLLFSFTFPFVVHRMARRIDATCSRHSQFWTIDVPQRNDWLRLLPAIRLSSLLCEVSRSLLSTSKVLRSVSQTQHDLQWVFVTTHLSIMCQGHLSVKSVGHKRLALDYTFATRCGVTHVANAHVPAHLLQGFLAAY